MSTPKQWFVDRIAASHVAGPVLKDIVPVCASASARGWKSTLGIWLGPGNSSLQVARECLSALECIATHRFAAQLAVKPSNFGFDDGAIRDVLGRARELGIRVHFDATDPESAPRSITFLERALTVHPCVGFTLPARWKRSLADADRMIELNIPVRVVWGQWKDATECGGDRHGRFLAVIDRLAGRGREVLVATHNAAIAREALSRLHAVRTPSELEQMFGLPLISARANPWLRAPIRLYVAYGIPYLPYNGGEIWRRPVLASWMARDFLFGRNGKLARLA